MFSFGKVSNFGVEFGKMKATKNLVQHNDNRFGIGNNDISFVPTENNIPKNVDSKLNFQTLFLLDTSYQFDIFLSLPRTFTITTKNGSSNFNYQMISMASLTISKELKKDPTNFEYHLDISDEENILEKFSQLFQGKKVIFTEEDQPVSFTIVRTLQITRCPDFLKPYNMRTGNYSDKHTGYLSFPKNKQHEEKNTKEIVIGQANFNCFILQNSYVNFTIYTLKNEYKCKLYAVYSSKVIQEFLDSNPQADSYKYDIEDEFNEFEIVNKIFNFEKVTITRDNIDILTKIINELEITCFYDTINNFEEKYDKMNNELNEEENKIDEINEMNEIFKDIDTKEKSEIINKIYKYSSL